MDRDERETLAAARTEQAEAPIRAASARADHTEAAHLTFALYGREILSFVSARLGCAEAGQEAFSMFAEDLWRGMASFAHRSSVRCWVHILARNATSRYARAPQRRRDRNQPLSEHPSALAVLDAPRSETRPHQRSEVKQRVRALRQRLSPSDQLLLSLHIERGLPFRELAQVVHADLGESEEAIAREAARLRKRFERVKRELRRMATAEGLLER